jgi:hypothetical protein
MGKAQSSFVEQLWYLGECLNQECSKDVSIVARHSLPEERGIDKHLADIKETATTTVRGVGWTTTNTSLRRERHVGTPGGAQTLKCNGSC